MARHGISIIGSLLFVLLFLSPMILADQVEFQELARDVPDDKLHAALHDYDGRYKHGIFPGDRPALEAVHRERAADATAIVLLAKRQSNNTTLSTSTRRSSTTTLPETPSSTSRASTSTTPEPPTSSSTSTRTTARETSTSPEPSSTPSSTPQTPSATPRGTTSYTSRITKTVTGANGEPSTTTEVTVVVAAITATAPGSSIATPSSTSPAVMQPGAASGLKVGGVELAAVAGGIAALVFFML